MLTLAKIAFCIVTLVYAFLTQVPLLGFDFTHTKFNIFFYSPVILLMFVFSIIFKNNYAFISLIIILLTVLFGLPLFSFGGGWQYILEPSFGYILAMIFMSVTVFYHTYHAEDKSHYKRNMLLAILSTNLFGIVFFIIFNQNDFIPVKIFVLQAFYDLVFAMIFLCLFKKKLTQ